MFYKGRSGNYMKVDAVECVGDDQVLVQAGDLEWLTSEDYFRANVVKSLAPDTERQHELEQFIESLPE